ncbi:MAG: hypothetical protein ACJA01_000311 [Saprospiraceae bacterium]|jgi:hypothetical protein
MKKSNLSLLSFTIILMILLIAYSFQLSNSKANNRNIRSSSWLEALGPEIVDSVKVTYKHLVCDFPVTSLDARMENELLIRGAKNGFPYASAKVKNDTLFLDYIQVDPNYKVADNKVNGRYPIHLIVGSKNLKSITILNKGKIFIDASPTGLDDNEPVYDSMDHVKNFQEYDKINIALKSNSQLEMFMHAKRVNLSTSKFRGSFDFEGYIKTLDFKYPEGQMGLVTRTYINVDSAFVHYNSKIKNNNAGILALNCKKYLFAELHADMDIFYKGNPTIDKIETDFGRVINSNESSKSKQSNITSQIETRDSSKVEEIINESLRKAQKKDSILEIRNTIDQLIKIPT